MNVTVEELRENCRVRVRRKGRATTFRHLATDSRRLKKDSLFFALQGPQFDGHDFVTQALRHGAVGAVVSKGRRIAAQPQRWLFAVDDPLHALGDTAALWRRHFDIPVIGITGSNGKTTTKEMVAHLLATQLRVLKTEGNFNNLIGLPLTLDRLNRRHQAVVLEMGMSAPGEIARLCEIAAPRIGVITNIARAHLAGLGSLNAVAKAKGEILQGLPTEGLAVLNADDDRVEQLAKRCRVPILRYGFSARADVRAYRFSSHHKQGCHFEVSGLGRRVRIHLNLPGRHNVSNALAAMAVAHYCGIPTESMAKGLRHITIPRGRLQRLTLAGATILNDSYNANPDSVIQSLEVLQSFPRRRRKIAVLGDMLELGRISREAHREVGAAAAQAGVDELIIVGHWASAVAAGAQNGGLRAARIHLCDGTAQAAECVKSLLKRGDVVLLKASRAMKLEEIIKALKRKRAT